MIPTFPHSVLDMSDVYEGQAESVQRGVALLPSGEVLIQDQLTGLKPGASVRWGMITPGTNDDSRFEYDSTATGRRRTGSAISSRPPRPPGK